LLYGFGARPGWRPLLAQALPFVATLPLLAYNAWILFYDPTIAEWAHQWRHQAPGPLSLLVSLGLPLLLALAGLRVGWRARDRALALMLVWPPLVAALLYLPNVANIQRRLLDAVYVPVGILAAVGLGALIRRLPRRRGRRVQALLLTACCLSSVMVLAIGLRFASGAFPEAYVANDAWNAMQWLSTHHQPSDRALSSPGSGQLLPAYAGVQVYVGHYSETLDYFVKTRHLQALLQPGTSATTVQSFLRANEITLVYWGPAESVTSYDPQGQPFLRRIYQAGSVAIYRVEP